MPTDVNSTPRTGGQGAGQGQSQLNIPHPLPPAGPPGLAPPAPAPPAPSPPAAAPSPASPQVNPQTAPAAPNSRPIESAGHGGADAGGSLTPNNAIIGGAIVLVLAVALLFLRGAIRSHLIAHKASPSAAGNAGWALFALLLSISITVVFGFFGALWSVLAFTIPLAVVIVITLILFIVLFNAATRAHR